MSNHHKSSKDDDEHQESVPVRVSSDETKIFMNEVILNADKLSKQQKQSKSHKWFIIGIFGGFFIFCLALFFIFIAVYLVKHAL